MQRLVYLSLLLLMACREAPGNSRAIELKFRGEAHTSFKMADVKLPVHEITVWEPYENREVTFKAISFNALLDRKLGRSWREQDEILFTCADGYQPSVPVQRFLEHSAYAAFGRRKSKFMIKKNESGSQKKRQLAPVYLVWENLKDQSIRAEKDYGWPYQVVSIDVVDFARKFARTMPHVKNLANAEKINRGFSAFRIHCFKCHAINGQGGSIGPELNYPVSVTEYIRPEWLSRWVTNPSSRRHNARMPALDPNLPEKNQRVAEIILYLQNMADHKQKP